MLERTIIVCLILFILWIPSSINAQEYTYHTYSVSEGLPVPEITCSTQDSIGFLWIGTHNGFSRYDGYNFINYLHIDSSKVGYVNRIRLGKNKDLFICTNNGLVVKKGKDFNFLNQEILKGQRIYDITIDKNHIYLASTKGIYKSYYSDNHTFEFQAFILSKDISSNYEDKFRSLSFDPIGHKLWFGTLYGVYSYSNNDIQQHKKFPYKAIITSIYHKEEKVFFSTKKNSGYVIDKGEVLNLFPKGTNARNLHISNDEIIFIANDSLQFVDLNSLNVFRKRSLKESGHKFFLNVFEDREHNLWLSTWEGLLKVTNTKFKQVTNLKNKEFYSILPSDNSLLLGANKGNLNELTIGNDSISVNNDLKLNSPAEIFDMLWFKNQLWIATGYDGIHILNQTKKPFKKLKKELVYPSVYNLKIIGGKLFALTDDGLSIFSDIDNFTNYSLKGFVDIVRFKDIIRYENEYWLCSDQGIYKLVNDGSLELVEMENHNITQSQFRNIIPLQGGHFLLASLDQGLLLVNIHEGKITLLYNVLKQLGIKDKNILDVIINENIAFVCTHKGIYKLAVSDSGNLFSLIEQCLINDGFINNAFQSLDAKIVENDLWVATTNGLGYWKDAVIKNGEKFPTILTELRYEDNDQDFIHSEFGNKEISIPTKAKNIRYYFSDLSYTNSIDNIYLFKLDDHNMDWESISKTNYKEFPKLPSGDYILNLSNQLNAGVSNSYRISKALPFHKTFLFYILVSLLTISALLGIHRFRMKKVEQKFKNEQARLLEINNYELKTLRAQMDPHFLFNTLNSIENFILKNDIQMASLYLNKFSTLVRKFLNQSKLEKIPISDVIETLKEYIELEMMRHEGKFNYNIYIDPALDTDFININPVLIQPFVENAIWHGLHPKKGSGALWLKFFVKNEDYIICIVKDDGIGREAAKKNKINSHQLKESMGLQLITRRLEAINKLYNKKGGVVINDINLPGENIKGTEVILTLPIM